MLDATDRALIALLRENARIGHAEAARRLRLSRTTVQARVESLERGGVIVGYTARLAEELSRKLVRAHITIVVAPKASAAVTSALQRMSELRALHSVAGPFDLLAVVEAEDAVAEGAPQLHDAVPGNLVFRAFLGEQDATALSSLSAAEPRPGRPPFAGGRLLSC